MPRSDRIGPADLSAVIRGYRDALRAHQERLNRLNVYPVPDGDTGTNMALTLESVVSELDGVDGEGVGMAVVCKAISHGSLMGARGNSGVIMSQVFRGLTDGLRGLDDAGGTDVAEALAEASRAAYAAVMHPVEGTILTVVREAAGRAQVAAAAEGATLVEVLDAAAAAAAEALERTPLLLAVLADAGVVDAGGAGFVLLLDVLLHVVDGRPVPDPPAFLAREPVPRAREGAKNDAGGRYEVMFLLDAADEGIPAMKRAWDAIGDSIVVVGGDGIWNCHVHTDDVGAAIEASLDAGRPRNIRVSDLAQEVEDERCIREAASASQPATTPTDAQPQPASSVIAVAVGDGVATILRSLGVESVVSGGQSMNPSTAELLAAVEASAGRAVILLPNNRNIVAVAERAAGLASKPVHIVPTTSVAEAFAALMGFDPGAEAEGNAKEMRESATRVSWGEVTWAVRDAATAAGAAREGDHLALLGHDIVAVYADLASAACALLERLVADDHEIVTIVEGERATPEATDKVRAWLGERRPKASVEVLRGGQPLAAYLFSAE